MSALSYEYSCVNRLEQPHSYMYTKYHGREFLDAYASSRDETIDYLRDVYETESGKMMPEDPYNIMTDSLKTIFRNGCPPDDLINFHRTCLEARTLDLLKLVIYRLVHHKNIDRNNIYFILSGFIQKYETFKRIYSVYGKGFRKVSSDFGDINCYIYFGAALGMYYREFGNLKILNCHLKINDLICSVRGEINDEAIVQLSCLSLLLEKKVVKELMQGKGVQ